MRNLIRKLVRGFAVAVAMGLILLAMSAGVLRLVVIQLPSYQGQIWEWVRTELGISLEFSRMDARWSLLGPEFSFRDATVSRVGGEANPIVSAVEAVITLSPQALLSERRLAVNRLTLEGSSLRLERTVDGTLRLANLPEDGAAQTQISLADIPPVTLVVSGGSVAYADEIRQREWAFDDVRVRLVRELGSIVVEAQANPPEDLAERIEVSAQLDAEGPVQDPQSVWRLFGEARGLDLAALRDLLPETWRLTASGAGDVSFWVDFAGNEARQATLALALQGLRVGGSGGAGADYEQIDVTLEGSRLDTGWAVSASNLELSREGRAWPAGAEIDVEIRQDDAGISSVSLRSSFLRLEDLAPLAPALPPGGIVGLWSELRPGGDMRDIEARLVRGRDSWRYAAVGSFDDLRIEPRDVWPGLQGFSGRLRMDSNSGRLDLDTREARVDWPSLFSGPLDVDELSGGLTWRQGASGLRFSSNDLVVNTPDGQTRSTLELAWPDSAGGVPTVSLQSEVRNLDAAGATRYFPVDIFPQVTAYLRRAILGGRVPSAEITVAGPLASFPFGNGEGRFHAEGRIEDGSMAYVEDWPVAEDLNGVLTFTNAGWEAAGSGRVLGNLSDNVRVGIEDMRAPVLSVAASTRGPLGEALRYLKEAPMIARHLGPDLARVQSGSGTADVTFELQLPLLDLTAYELSAALEISGGDLSIDGFGPTVTGIDGGLRLQSGQVLSRGNLVASFLDAPVSVSVAAAGEPGYLADIGFEGVFPAESLQAEFNLPFVGQVPGASAWQGRILLPENRFVQARREPLRIDLATDLQGVDLNFPEPLMKPPAQATQLGIEVVFAEADRLNVSGRLGEDHRFALSFRNRDGELSFRRGALRFGGAEPLLPPRDGLSVSGELASLDFDGWWNLFRQQVPGGSAAGLLLGAELEIADFSAFGQPLGPIDISLRQQAARWQLQADSEPVAGVISWPLDLGDRPQMLAEMERLHISTEGASGDLNTDPRGLPGVLLHADDFSLGTRRFGAFDADIRASREGLDIVSLSGRTESFVMEGSGSWYQGPQGQETRLVLAASSEDVAGALEQLGFDPIMEAGRAQLALNVYWPSGPAPGWEDSITGGLNLRLERGSILNLDPGAGRMVGLMSIAALPRRLALDFRDVFNRGLVFDELGGDFVIIDGNAYTDNLRLAGPVVDIGLVGRTGLRDRDYQQHAVVTSEPGRILPAVGFLASPQVAAALLLFSEIFKEPLNGATRASYCVTGSWSEPQVERQTAEQLEQNRLCADLPQLAVAVEP